MNGCMFRAISGENYPTVIWSYMGRKAHQVKIRGAKVEVGEIEAVYRNTRR